MISLENLTTLDIVAVLASVRQEVKKEGIIVFQNAYKLKTYF